jgi:para-nitrobenzyl esterase
MSPRKRVNIWAAISAAAILSPHPSPWPVDAAARPSLQTSCAVVLRDGGVQGADLGSSCAFLGVPYAATTAGGNRWRPPQPVSPWSPNVLAVTAPPFGCPSIGAGAVPSFGGNEDCLKLNIWAPDPAPAAPAPVIVWLHTGAFMAASANFPGTNGRRLAEETGAIVVAPNYRLGAFGFLVHPLLAAEPGGSSGNYGLLDQQAALRWVQANIAQFGGDPDNVTLAGSSAGGQSVGLQLVSPGSEGLFHRAIVQSAYPTSRWLSAAEATTQGLAFAAALGCSNAACLRAASRDAVLGALPQAAQQVVEPAMQVFWEPVVDGTIIPDQPRLLFEAGRFHPLPTIVGFTRDEGWGSFITRSFSSGVTEAQYEHWLTQEFGPFAAAVSALYPADIDPLSEPPAPAEAMARVVGDGQFVCEARRLARLIEQQGVPVYLFSYEHEIPALAGNHVVHGLESNIIFGNNYVPPLFQNYTLTAAELTLHAAMSGYWTRLAATGNPNTDDESVVRWPAFKHPTGEGRGADKYLVFAPMIHEALRPRERECDFFAPLFLRSMLAALPAGAQ